jgi:hypothetical protein
MLADLTCYGSRKLADPPHAFHMLDVVQHLDELIGVRRGQRLV